MQRLRQFISTNLYSMLMYLTIGGITAAIYFGVFAFMWSVLGINYQLDVSTAYVLSTAFHFFANRQYTFNAANGNLGSQALKYLIVIAANYAATIWIVTFCVERLSYSPYVGVFAAVAATTAISFAFFHFWVFSSSFKIIRG